MGVYKSAPHDGPLQELMLHVANVVSEFTEATNPVPLVEYLCDKLTRRIGIITDADAEISAIDELVTSMPKAESVPLSTEHAAFRPVF